MEKTIIIFTIFTLFLFTITTAVIATDPAAVTDAADDSIKTQTFIIKSDQSPRFVFYRPHPVKHEIDRTNNQMPLRFVKRHPCRKFLKKKVMIPRSYGNDMIVDSNTVGFDTETIGNEQVPVKFLEFKHGFGHRLHHHHHEHHDDDHEEYKKRGYKGGFARRIRKFLKHTFD